MKNLRSILRDLETQKISLTEAEKLLKIDYLENLEGLAQLDVFRQMRTGIPEVIFAASKSTKMVLEITKAMLAKNEVKNKQLRSPLRQLSSYFFFFLGFFSKKLSIIFFLKRQILPILTAGILLVLAH